MWEYPHPFGTEHIIIGFPAKRFGGILAKESKVLTINLVDVLPFTLAKFNIEPENDGLEDVSPLPGVYSQVPC